MSKNKIPDLKNVLNQNWPDATWTIPALFNNEQALIGLLSESKTMALPSQQTLQSGARI